MGLLINTVPQMLHGYINVAYATLLFLDKSVCFCLLPPLFSIVVLSLKPKGSTGSVARGAQNPCRKGRKRENLPHRFHRRLGKRWNGKIMILKGLM